MNPITIYYGFRCSIAIVASGDGRQKVCVRVRACVVVCSFYLPAYLKKKRRTKGRTSALPPAIQ